MLIGAQENISNTLCK